MDIRKIKKLIELVESSSITELEVSEGEESIRICRTTSAAPSFVSTPQIIQTTGQTEAPSQITEPSGHILRSPMVGTFYTASSSEADDFVTLGQQVKAGETLCIVEAMKMMNQVEADKDGIIKEILAENGQPIEFDQPLFVIE